jgi:hypothetical protein
VVPFLPFDRAYDAGNGDSCRLYSRKAQYGWGWDWGPVMMTVGPWRGSPPPAYRPDCVGSLTISRTHLARDI